MEKFRFILNKYKEVFMYILIGVLTTLVNLVSYTFMYKILNFNLHISNIISILIAIIFAYFTNRIFVFQCKSENIEMIFVEFLKFVSSRLFTMTIEVVGVYIFVVLNGDNELIGKIKIQIITLVINYLLSKFIIFKK